MLCWEYPPKYSGGLGIACQGMAEALVNKGHDVSVLLPTNEKNAKTKVKLISASSIPAKDYLPDYSKQSDDSVYEEVSMGKSIVPYLPPQFFRKNQPKKAAELPKEIMEFMKSLTITGDYTGSIFLELKVYALIAYHLVQKNKFDVVHAHDWMTLPAARMISKYSESKVVSHVHSTEIDRNSGWANEEVIEIEKFGFQSVPNIVAVSEQQQRRLIKEYGIDPDKIHVIPNGLAKPLKPTSEPKKPIVGFIGRLVHQKGPRKFLDIARQLKNRDSNISFSIVGEGYLRDDLEDASQRLNLRESLKFEGFLEHKKALKWLSGLKLLIVPSGAEPFGLVALEAASLGVPVIISSGSGICEFIPEFIQHNQWDVHAFVGSSVKILEDDAFREQYISSCKKAADALSWKNSANEISKLYNHLDA